MIRQAIRHSLVPLSVLVLTVGLASPPAEAAAGPPGRSPSTSAPPVTANVPAAPSPTATLVAGSEPAPVPEMVDLATGPGDHAAAPPPAPPTGVREAIAADGTAEVIITLREQADLDALAEEAAAAGESFHGSADYT